MLKKGIISNTEYLMGEVSKELYEMYVAGVSILEGVKVHPLSQLKEYEEKAKGATGGELKTINTQIGKLKKVIKKGGYDEKQEFVEGVEALEVGAKTQKAEILKHLKEKGSITSFEAFANYGVTRLAAIIHVLRTKQGLNIQTSKQRGKNRYNNPTIYAKYTLLED